MSAKRYTTIFTAIIFFFLAIYFPAQALQSMRRGTASDSVTVPIIMYHKISKDSAQWGQFTISPDEFEADLKYLKDNGYQTVGMTDLINFVKGRGTLPDKPVVLTFDDGYFTDYRYAMPLLEKYQMKAVFSVIGKITDEYTADGREDITYPHLTWPMISEMIASGCAELQNHGYDVHEQKNGVKGAQRLTDETDEAYRRRFSEDINTLQARALEMTGVLPNTFTYPFGAYSSISDQILKDEGFSASLICAEKPAKLTAGDDDCLFGLGRLRRDHNKSISVILDQLEI